MVEDIIRALNRRDCERRIPVIRLEIDYELALLWDLMKEENVHNIDQCKARLAELSREMTMLEGWSM